MRSSSWIKQNEKTAPLRPVVTKFLCKGEKKTKQNRSKDKTTLYFSA